jgi:hypothetical protein
MVTVAGYEFYSCWLRTSIAEQIKEERLLHVSTPETNSWTVICDTFKAFSFLITYAEEVYTVSEVFFFNFSLTHYHLYSVILLWVKVMPGNIKCPAKGVEKQHVEQPTFRSLWFLLHSILSRNKLYLGHPSVVNSEVSVAGEGHRQVHVICVSLRILFSIQISKMFWELVCDSRLVTIANSPIHFRTATQVGCNYFMYEIPCVMFNLWTSRHPEF